MKTSLRIQIILAAIVVLALIGIWISYAINRTSENAQEMAQWPTEISTTHQFCSLDNYRNCKDGDWFGIHKSEIAALTSNLAEYVCQEPRKFDNATFFRRLTLDQDYLFLCRMNDPKIFLHDVLLSAKAQIDAVKQKAKSIPQETRVPACASLLQESGYDKDTDHAGAFVPQYLTAIDAAATGDNAKATLGTVQSWKGEVSQALASEKLGDKGLAVLTYDRYCR